MLPRPTIIGVVNVTPDSFSDGGHFLSSADAVRRAEQLLDDGADIVEFGGESTRPGATPVSADEELSRILPVIEQLLCRRPDARIAVDTVKSAVASAALAQGASIINDVSAFSLDPEMGVVCARAGCTVVLMHSRGNVQTMASYDHATYREPVVTEIRRELLAAVDRATSSGVSRGAIVLDPGIGFAKTPEQSLQALANLSELADLGFTLMVGASRKRFIGEITGVQLASERDEGTIGAHVVALTRGATWFRVHNVRAHRHALDVAHAVVQAGMPVRSYADGLEGRA